MEEMQRIRRKRTLPSRTEQVKTLQSGEEFDVLIIGGGATGAGCALDAVTRGLKTALVEADDFASGTSSKSTKLIHGGVRYLQKAILGVGDRRGGGFEDDAHLDFYCSWTLSSTRW